MIEAPDHPYHFKGSNREIYRGFEDWLLLPKNQLAHQLSDNLML
jgi:hypothetical protein